MARGRRKTHLNGQLLPLGGRSFSVAAVASVAAVMLLPFSLSLCLCLLLCLHLLFFPLPGIICVSSGARNIAAAATSLRCRRRCYHRWATPPYVHVCVRVCVCVTRSTMCLEIEAVTAANSIQMFLAQSRKPKQSKQTIWALASKQSSRGSGGGRGT